MISFFSRYTVTSDEEPQKEHFSKTRNIPPRPEVKTERKNEDETDSKTVSGQSVCFFMHSSGSLPQKHPMLLEEILSNERWEGHVIAVDDQNVIADAYKVGQQQRRYRLKIEKAKILNIEVGIAKGTELIITNQRVRTYQGDVQNKTVIRIREYLSLPEDVVERNFEERMARYSYMFKREE